MAEPTFAQSSMTVYGVIDVGINSDSRIPVRNASGSNYQSRLSIDSGGQTASLLGLRGAENLGGATNVNFVFETGFCADSPGGYCTGSNYFGGRQTFVGVERNGIGRLNLGRQYSPHYKVLSAVDPFGAGLAGTITNVFTNVIRYSNSIGFMTTNLGGFIGQAMYSAGEVAGDNADGRSIGLAAEFSRRPFYVGAAFHRAKPTTASDAVDAVQATFLGMIVDMGPAKLHLAYAPVRRVDNGSALDRNEAMIGLTVPVGASTLLMSYAKRHYKDPALNDPSMVALGWTYRLSMRTNTYIAFASGRNSALTINAIPIPGDAGLIGDAGNFGFGERKLQLGLRHQF